MKHNRLQLQIISGALVLAGSALGICGLLPFGAWKQAGDWLSRDGSLESLTPGLWGWLHWLFFGLGLLALIISAGTFLWKEKAHRALGAVDRFMMNFWQEQRSLVLLLRVGNASRLEWGLLGLVILLGVGLRLSLLQGPMKYDEAYTFVAFASRPAWAGLSDYHLPNNHVLHTFLVHMSTLLLGSQAWSVRLPAFLAGVLIIPAAWRLARAMFDRESAMLAAGMAASMPILAAFSANARGYSMLSLFTLALFGLGWLVLKRSSLAAWFWIALISALGMFTVPVMAYSLGIFYVWLALCALVDPAKEHAGRLAFWAGWWISGFTAGLLTLVFYIPVFIGSGWDALFNNPFVQPRDWSFFLETLNTRIQSVWDVWMQGTVSFWRITLAAGFLLSVVIRQKSNRVVVPVPWAAFPVLGVMLLLQRPLIIPRMWLALVPMFLVYAAAGILRIIPASSQKQVQELRLAFTALLLGTTVWMMIQMMATNLGREISQPGKVEQAAMKLKGELQPGDVVVADLPVDAPFWYYARIYQIADDHVREFEQRQQINRVFVLVSQSDNQQLEKVLEGRGPQIRRTDPASCVERWMLGNLRVFECRPEEKFSTNNGAG